MLIRKPTLVSSVCFKATCTKLCISLPFLTLEIFILCWWLVMCCWGRASYFTYDFYMFRAKKVAHCKNYSITWKPQAPRVFWSWKPHRLVPSDLLLPCRYLGMRFLWRLPCAGSSPCVQDAYGLSEVHQCLEPDGPVAQQAMTVALIPCGYSWLLTLDCPQLSSSPGTVFNGRKLQVTPICGDSPHLISGQWWGVGEIQRFSPLASILDNCEGPFQLQAPQAPAEAPPELHPRPALPLHPPLVSLPSTLPSNCLHSSLNSEPVSWEPTQDSNSHYNIRIPKCQIQTLCSVGVRRRSLWSKQ